MGRTGFLERLQNGGSIVVAEGYIFELERRGYLQAGSFVPEVVLEHPHLYYAHREKLRVVGRENDLDALNRAALKMAREVADENGCLMAGNICNSALYFYKDENTHAPTENMFKEQIEIAVEMGADYIVGETYSNFSEALLALKCIHKYGKGLPSVITLSASAGDYLSDGYDTVEACKKLEEAGTTVVGLNCGRGPSTMLPLLQKIKQACGVPIAALPVVYNTTLEEPTFHSLTIPGTDTRAFPLDLCSRMCSRQQIEEFGTKAKELGIQYVGLCCGNSSNMLRIVAEKYGRTPPASKYSPDMEKHYIYGDKTKFRKEFTEDLMAVKSGKA
ncbi:hypothetical protein ACF0H5_019726 [Mactra antiquata]